MEDANRWLAHNAMSDPGRHAGAIAVLPADVGALSEIIQGVLVHSDWAGEHGMIRQRWARWPAGRCRSASGWPMS